jgi:ABC-2 type transport system permease protein
MLRHLFLQRKSYDRISEIFYWPAVDILIWGLTYSFFRGFLPASGHIDVSKIVLTIMACICFWLITWRIQYDFPISLLEDLWNKNFINLFVTPLKFSEWALALMFLGFFKILLSGAFAFFLAWLLYSVKVISLGFYLVPLIMLLLLNGWWMGFVVAGIIFRFGTRVQVLAWSLGMLFAPFYGIYYPVTFLPHWAQKISFCFPATYVFENARAVIDHGSLNWPSLLLGYALCFLYLALAVWFLKAGFKKVLNKGLVKLY